MLSHMFAATATFPSALYEWRPLSFIISMQKLMKSQGAWLESGLELCSSRAFSLLRSISSINSQGNTNSSGNSQLGRSLDSKNLFTSLQACIHRNFLASCPLEASKWSVLLEMIYVSDIAKPARTFSSAQYSLCGQATTLVCRWWVCWWKAINGILFPDLTS